MKSTQGDDSLGARGQVHRSCGGMPSVPNFGEFAFLAVEFIGGTCMVTPVACLEMTIMHPEGSCESFRFARNSSTLFSRSMLSV